MRRLRRTEAILDRWSSLSHKSPVMADAEDLDEIRTHFIGDL